MNVDVLTKRKLVFGPARRPKLALYEHCFPRPENRMKTYFYSGVKVEYYSANMSGDNQLPSWLP